MNNKQKTILIKIIISTCFLITAIITSCFTALNDLKITTLLLMTTYFIIGCDVILKTIKNTINLNLFDENFLICIATLGAFCLNEHFEAVTIILLYQIGEFFQNLALIHSQNSIRNLLSIKSETVNLKTKNNIVQTKPEIVEIGSTIVIMPGEQILIDGVVISGTSELNTASITGEFKNLKIKPGDKILSGSINLTNAIEIKTSQTFQNSTVKQMLKLIKNAKQKKANSEKFITKFAKIYTPIIVFVALTTATLPTIFFNQIWTTWLQNSIVLLSISCPCALVISIPISFFGTISTAAKNSILIKTNNVIEKINKVKTIIFDKTGTLTFGNFEIVEINPKKISKDELIKLLNTAELLTNHPIANAIKSKFKNLKINKTKIIDCEEFPGLGVKTTTKNKTTIIAGNGKLMEKFKINYEKTKKISTIIYVAKNQTYVGNVIISDRIRPESKQTIQKLRKLKIQNIALLTGDEKIIAEETAKILNLDSSLYKQLPHEKVNQIKKFQKKGPLIFVGDGINDSPALATADIGIAMGKHGADIAINSADIILIDNKLTKIADIIKISKKTMRIIKQNITISILIKLVILITVIIGKTNIWLAIFSDVGVSIITIANSLRTLRSK